MRELKNKFSVYLLEDDVMYKKMLAYAFGDDAELDVSFFTTGASFLEQFRQRPSDIVIMDYSLPDFSGQELLKALRKHAPDTPVVIVSGSVSPATIDMLYREGAYEFLAKDMLIRTRLNNVLNNIKSLLSLRAENAALRDRKNRKNS